MNFTQLWNGAGTAAWLNHLWQSTAVVAIAWFLTLILKQNRARARYCVWFCASVKFLLPFGLLIAAGEWVRSLAPTATTIRPAAINVMFQMTQPFVEDNYVSATGTVSARSMHWEPWILLTVWACGALIIAVRFVRAWLKMHAAKRTAALSQIAADVPVLISRAPIEPGIFGIVRPVLLIPEGILQRLSAEQMSTIIAHEMAHVRRRDNLSFAIHMLVETVFWFHPAVWWIASRLIEERERACDEAVLQIGSEAETYAESILSVCRYYVESPLACVSGVTGSDLKKRVTRIIESRVGARLGTEKKWILTAVALASLLGPLGIGLLQAMQAQLFHPDDHPLPSFEVATIKPNVDTSQTFKLIFPPAHFAATHASLNDLLKFAYSIKSKDQLVNAPHWLNSEFFDIQAKAEEPEIEEFNKMNSQGNFEGGLGLSRLLVQTLLRDRFQMKAHFELRELPIFALTVAKGGPKIHEVEMDALPSPGEKPKPGGHYPNVHRSDANQLSGTLKMPMLADLLTNSDEVGGRVIVDRTNLAGYYDFVLKDIALGSQQPSPNGLPAPAVGTISLFTALREQLGLELRPQTTPVEVLVIDQVEQPSPN